MGLRLRLVNLDLGLDEGDGARLALALALTLSLGGDDGVEGRLPSVSLSPQLTSARTSELAETTRRWPAASRLWLETTRLWAQTVRERWRVLGLVVEGVGGLLPPAVAGSCGWGRGPGSTLVWPSEVMGRAVAVPSVTAPSSWVVVSMMVMVARSAVSTPSTVSLLVLTSDVFCLTVIERRRRRSAASTAAMAASLAVLLSVAPAVWLMAQTSASRRTLSRMAACAAQLPASCSKSVAPRSGKLYFFRVSVQGDEICHQQYAE
jgi:hypothetical protein